MDTALIFIDVQQSLVDEGIWDAHRVIARLNQLIAAARLHYVPVILVRVTRVEPDGSFHNRVVQLNRLSRTGVTRGLQGPYAIVFQHPWLSRRSVQGHLIQYEDR